MQTMLCDAIKTNYNDKWGCSIILYDKMNSNRFLICKRAPGERQEPKTWGLPGGKVEIGESALAAIERELKEETGLTLKSCKYIGCFAADGWIDFTFISCDYSGEIKLDHEECTDYRWVTIKEFKDKYFFTERLIIFSLSDTAIQLYDEWKAIQTYKEMEEARNSISRQYP